MRNNKINYLIVGTFVLTMLAGMIVAMAMLAGRTGATDSYYAFYRNVTGVKFGTQVVYEGYPIGQVEEVIPEPDGALMRFRVIFEVQQGWRIPKDSVGKIEAPGLLSAITLSIRAGKSGTALKPGAEVTGEEASDIFAMVSSVAGEIGNIAEKDIRPFIASLGPLLETINRAAGGFGDIMVGDGKILVGDLVTLVGELNLRVPIIADDIQDFTDNINRSSQELSAFLTPENRLIVEDLLQNMDAAAINFTELSAELDTLIGDMDELIALNQNNISDSLIDVRYITDSLARRIDSINQNLEGASRNMYEFSRQIRQNPGLLLGGTPPVDEAAQ
ncbi:MAG TPA: MCE family protein [Rhodospirillales bacterium]|nr:MCE family protein [Rhodospirillales bacterium]